MRNNKNNSKGHGDHQKHQGRVVARQSNKSRFLMQEVSFSTQVHPDDYLNFVVDHYYAKWMKKYTREEILQTISNFMGSRKNEGGHFQVMLPLYKQEMNVAGLLPFKDKESGKKVYYAPIPNYVAGQVVAAAAPRVAVATAGEIFAEGDRLLGLLRATLQQQPAGAQQQLAEQAQQVVEQALHPAGAVQIAAEEATPQPAVADIVDRLVKARDQERQAVNQLSQQLGETLSQAQGSEAASQKQVDRLKRELEQVKTEKKTCADTARQQANTIQEQDNTIRKQEKQISGLNYAVEQAQKDSAEYRQKVVFYRGVQEFAAKGVAFLDEYDRLQVAARALTNMELPAEVADDFNYYLLRILKKFDKAVTSIKQADVIAREIRLLAQTGIVPTGGYVDKLLQQVKQPKEQHDTLQLILFQSLFRQAAGAAIVMSDELAYLLPQMVSGVGQAVTQPFAQQTERLLKAVEALGYQVDYVKPFTRMTDYRDVKNVQFAEADLPSGTIFEVFKMAVNFGTMKENTEVSAKQ